MHGTYLRQGEDNQYVKNNWLVVRNEMKQYRLFLSLRNPDIRRRRSPILCQATQEVIFMLSFTA